MALVEGLCGDHGAVVERYRALVALFPQDEDHVLAQSVNLATALVGRYEHEGGVADLEESERLLTGVLEAVDGDSTGRVEAATRLARTLKYRYDVDGGRDDLERGHDLLEAALREVPLADISYDPEDSEDEYTEYVELHAEALNQLSVMLREIALLRNDRGLLESAVGLAQEAWERVPEGSSHASRIALGLVVVLGRLAEVGADPSTLEEACSLGRALVESARNQDESLTVSMLAETEAVLADNLALRFRLLGDPSDLIEALELLRSAAARLPRGAPDRAAIEANITVLDRDHQQTLAHTRRLTEAVRVAEDLASRYAEGSNWWLHAVHNQAQALLDLYSWQGGDDRPGQARSLARRALDRATPGSSMAEDLLQILASAILMDERDTADVASLDQVIDGLSGLLREPGRSPLFRARTHHNLAYAHYLRFERTGRLGDLEDAARLGRLAVSGAADTDRFERINALGAILHARYERHGQERDIHDAVTLLEEAAESAPTENDRAHVHVNLGGARLGRYGLGRDPEDLAAAERSAEFAYRSLPATSPDHMSALINLTLAAVVRAEREHLRGDTDDHSTPSSDDLQETTGVLRQAIGILEEKLALSTEPTSTGWFVLAAAYRLLHELGAQEEDDDRAEDHYRQALERAFERRPAAVLEGAIEWGARNFREGRWERAVEAFDQAIAMLRTLVAEQVERVDRESWLTTAVGLPGMAALASWRSGDNAGAVRRLEETRALLLAEHLGDRASRSETAEPGPAVVYLVPGRTGGGVALCVDRSTGVVADVALPEVGELGALVWLDRFVRVGLSTGVEKDAEEEETTIEETGSDAPDREGTLVEFAAWWWEHLLRPVTEHLGETTELSLSPVGELAQLPLQACGPDLRTAGSALLDTHAVRFPPIRTRGGEGRTDIPARRYLGVALTRTPGYRELPHAETEVREVSALFEDRTRLFGADATPHDVLVALGDVDVAHFACHAVIRRDRPLESALLLHDARPLTVGEILDTSMRAKLVILSACATMQTGFDLPDEAVGFPTTFIAAGAREVVATAWPTSDLASRLLIEEFVRRWCAGVPGHHALRGAQLHVRSLSDEALLERLERGNTHPGAQTGPLGSPLDWAQFTFTG
ncbi:MULTISPECIES: CHAT domain-containing protein [unclassified Nocardiopsis]|uniref:CHAT domain-containing protein n=1 Tax=Nocardiopsis TaxID=2013 RepID=UPI00387A9B7C